MLNNFKEQAMHTLILTNRYHSYNHNKFCKIQPILIKSSSETFCITSSHENCSEKCQIQGFSKFLVSSM